TEVKEMVDELLRMCRILSKNSFMPRLKPAISMVSASEGLIPFEDEAVYRLLVPLKPRHGHAFHLELGT
ncbi:hypothetical protein FQV07_0014798, partial [Pygoscelis papua]